MQFSKERVQKSVLPHYSHPPRPELLSPSSPRWPRWPSQRICPWESSFEFAPWRHQKERWKQLGGMLSEWILSISNIYKLLGALNFCSIWGVWACIFNVATQVFQIIPTIVAFKGQCHRWIDKCFTHKAKMETRQTDLMASSSSSWSISSAESKQQNRVSSCPGSFGTRFQGHTEILQES